MIELLIFLLFWGGFSYLVGRAAESRGRNFWPWYLLAFFMSPLVAIIFLLAFGSKSTATSLEVQKLKTHEAELELEIEKLKHSN